MKNLVNVSRGAQFSQNMIGKTIKRQIYFKGATPIVPDILFDNLDIFL